MTVTYSSTPEVQTAITALVSICERHTTDGIAVINLDCGDCGSRQEATSIYLLGVIKDAWKGLGL